MLKTIFALPPEALLFRSIFFTVFIYLIAIISPVIAFFCFLLVMQLINIFVKSDIRRTMQEAEINALIDQNELNKKFCVS